MKALLSLLQLASPALPVGAYAYSQGLEYAVEVRWVSNEAQLCQWLSGGVKYGLAHTDLAVMRRIYSAWEQENLTAVDYWNDYLFALRESREWQHQERHLGQSLAKLLFDLGISAAGSWQENNRCCYVTLLSLAARHWHIGLAELLAAYTFSWCENQVMVALKLLPLGQTAGQRVLLQLKDAMLSACEDSYSIVDQDIGFSMPALAIASCLHETQYTRLFRS